MLTSSDTFLSLFQLGVSVVGALIVCLGGLYYFTHVRLERPAIGTFNARDVGILLVALILLPTLYLVVPRWALTGLLVVAFVAALSIGYGPVLSPGRLWLGIGLLIGADLWMGQRMIDNPFHWSFVWAENSVVVALAAIAVANLYVQGGMRLQHVTGFAAALAVYDALSTFGFQVSNLLLRAFVNYPLFPAMGMRIGFDEAVIGLGDLLVYCAFTLAAFKAYGRIGLRLALSLVLIFGAVLPSLSVLLFDYVDARLDVVIPAQTWFGPAAIIGYLWLRKRYGRERTMGEFLAGTPAANQVAAPTPTPSRAPRVASISFPVAEEDRPVLDELVRYFGQGDRAAYLRETLTVMRSVQQQREGGARPAGVNGHGDAVEDLDTRVDVIKPALNGRV